MSESEFAVGGGSPVDPSFAQVLGAFAMMSGPDVYLSGYHFTVVQNDATKLDLSGGFPEIKDETQFVALLQRSSAGVATVFFPQTSVFSWDAANSRLTVAGATFAGTDKYQLVIRGGDRFASLPDNALLMLLKNHYQLKSDSAGVPFGTVPQNFTTTWVDFGPEIYTYGMNTLKLWLTFLKNDSTGLRVRLLDKHESAGVEEYNPQIETLGASVISVAPQVWQQTTAANELLTLLYKLDGVTPYVQTQIQCLVEGGTKGQVTAGYYTRGWR